MSDNEPSREESIFSQALELESDQDRTQYLGQACGSDARLRADVEALLRAHRQTGDLLDIPEASHFQDSSLELPGTEIGVYKIRQRIAAGGMGVVYLADQEHPVQRQVALKIIKPGMDSEEIIARFEVERQALALMDHPNIARVLDAGTTEKGRPFFVMELVNGKSITNYCDEHQLSLQQRLELFIPICQAIQHAHQKGIIHRDLKPSNLLVAEVDGRPIPKVIDFGVAKATAGTLTDNSVFTELGHVLGTVEYMSPEQAVPDQRDIDTRSDIYSLGAVLYELLTGDTPFDRRQLKSKAMNEMLRIIREDDPPRPSMKLSGDGRLASLAAKRKTDAAKLSTMLRAELDWIVMRALEKERGRRYETASAFAQDIEHYLKDQPVAACPPSAAYRFRKFARRNKALIGTAAAVAVAILLGLAATSVQMVRAMRAEDLAGERLVVVEQQKDEITQEKQALVDEQRFRRLLNESQRISLARQRWSGWRQAARTPLIDAMNVGARDELAAAFSRTLSGVDASVIHQWAMDTGRLSFNDSGSHVVLAIPGGGARLVALDSGEQESLDGYPTHSAGGPVGFNAVGQPIQVTCDSPSRFVVVRLGTDPLTRPLDLPAEMLDDGVRQSWAELDAKERASVCDRLDALAQATPDLSRVVTWHGLPSGESPGSETTRGIVALWDANTGEILQTVSASEGALAIAPDGSVFAVLQDDGVVAVHSPDAGPPLAVIQTGFRQVSALAFGYDPRRLPQSPGAAEQLSQWLLAVADAAGTISVWDLKTVTPISVYRGIVHDVHLLKFAPGSLVLGSGGHRHVQLWDTFGNGHLLSLNPTNDQIDFAWSSDGSMLGTSGLAFGQQRTARIWRLEQDRGIRTLRGLSTATANVVFSPDGRQIAAVANDWTIGVWDIETRQLRRHLSVPPGFTVDNCDTRFSRDGASLYFSAGQAMTKWDLETGAQLAAWDLPLGLQDQIGIDGDKRVLLMRYDLEKESPYLPSKGGVCRLREMRADGSSQVLAEWKGFTGRINWIEGTRDGGYFVMGGTDATGAKFSLLVNGYIGQLIDRIDEPATVHGGFAIADKALFVSLHIRSSPDNIRSVLVDLTNGDIVRRLTYHCATVSSDGTLGYRTGAGAEEQWTELYDFTRGKRLARFELKNMPSYYQADFSLDGKYLAWANLDGTVAVCDLQQAAKEFTLVGAGWQPFESN